MFEWEPLRKARPAPYILGMLFVAAGLDYLTGPAISSAGLYIFPVALASLRTGARWGIATVLAAGTLNVVADYSSSGHPLSATTQATNELIHLGVYIVVWYFCVMLSRQQESLERQHALMTQQRDQMATLNLQMSDEMQAARVIQKLLTGDPPHHPAVDIALHLEPARILGGDCLDLAFGPNNNTLAIAVGDVSGKGSPAALAGAVMTGLLGDAPERFTSPARTLDYLNRRIEGYLPDDMFVTLFYGLLNLETGVLTWACAGHEPPFLLHAEANTTPPDTLIASGFPLGWFSSGQYEEKTLRMVPGDTLFLFTDGLTELRLPGGDFLGAQRLRVLAQECPRDNSHDFVETLLTRCGATNADLADDLTALAVRFVAAPRATVQADGRSRVLMASRAAEAQRM